MPTITYEASPCSVCKAMVAIDTMWRCVRCGQLTCMRHTSKSAMNGGVCKNCFPSLSSFQQQYMKAENEKMDKLFKKGLFNPNALKEFYQKKNSGTVLPIPETPESLAAVTDAKNAIIKGDTVDYEKPGGYLEDGKWHNGKICLKGAKLEFESKHAAFSIPLEEIASATIGEKGNFFNVFLKDGREKHFRADKGQTWVEKINAALPK